MSRCSPSMPSTPTCVAELTEADLEKLQIPLGDRKRLLKAIRGTFAETDAGKAERQS